MRESVEGDVVGTTVYTECDLCILISLGTVLLSGNISSVRNQKACGQGVRVPKASALHTTLASEA